MPSFVANIFLQVVDERSYQASGNNVALLSGDSSLNDKICQFLVKVEVLREVSGNPWVSD